MELEECVVGLAVLAVSRRWPQPLVLRDGKLRLTQAFVDFHRKDASEQRLVLVLRVQERTLFFTKYENVDGIVKMLKSHDDECPDFKWYDHTKHMACLIDYEDNMQIITVPFSPLPEEHKLPLNYCAKLRECELPCEDHKQKDETSVCSLETFYDILDEMKTAGLSEKEIMKMLHPHITSGGITWSKDALFTVRSLDDVLTVRKDAQRMIDRIKFCSAWSPQLLRVLNLHK